MHLALTHFPIFGSLIGLLILFAGVILRKPDIVKTGYATWIIVALVAIPVFLTGEPAEETVEHLPGVSEAIIEQHEEIAEMAFTAVLILGGASLLLLIFEFLKVKIVNWLRWPAIIGGIIVFGLMAYTGNLGGQIRHSEIRKDGTPPVENIDGIKKSGKSQREKDDDD